MKELTEPSLQRREHRGIAWWTDTKLADFGVEIAFTERIGGASSGPYTSLNLAAHVGDEPSVVDENRSRLLEALGLSATRDRLTVAEQVHGTSACVIDEAAAGQGAWAVGGRAPVAQTDALVTSMASTPLLLCFADCVPVVLVAPGPVVAAVHAGWRGALGGLPGKAVGIVAKRAACEPSQVSAYVGPHIGACHYPVSEEILSQFVNAFGTFARAESGGLDLGTVVAEDLARSGVLSCRIALLGACTAEQTDRFFSYRAEGGLTGRHGSLVCIRS